MSLSNVLPSMQLVAQTRLPVPPSLQLPLEQARAACCVAGGEARAEAEGLLLNVSAFSFRGSLWVIAGDRILCSDPSTESENREHSLDDVLGGELGERLRAPSLEPGFLVDDKRALLFLRGLVEGEFVCFPVVLDTDDGMTPRWQVLYPDLEKSPHDWRIAAGEPRSLFATEERDVFEVRGALDDDGERAPFSGPNRWTLHLGKGRYHFGATRPHRAKPPLLCSSTRALASAASRTLHFQLEEESGRSFVVARRRGSDEKLFWFGAGEPTLRSVPPLLCRGTLDDGDALCLDLTNPTELVVRRFTRG
ncbi:MAG: hypothetical protein ACO3JL_06405 [Myxococcota bacterium]